MVTSPAFDLLVARHEREVVAICRAILADDHLSRDAAQETFLRLWTRLQGDRGPERPAGWLRRVAVSTALDLARRGAGARREAGDVDELPGPAPAAERALDATELFERYAAALAELPEGQRTVFVLRHEAGLPLVEVAETLGVARTTVKTQFARACVRLQARLRPFAPEPPTTPTPDDDR